MHRPLSSLLLAGLLTVPTSLLARSLPPGAASGGPPRQALQYPEAPVAVCVVTPRVEPVEAADALGLVPVPRPRLIVVEPLLELRIQRAGSPPWTLTGTVEEPIPIPLDWPTSPIAPEEVILLQLRPREAPAEAFAHVYLVGASASRMAATQALVQRLPPQGSFWLDAIETALTAGDVPVAWALLFSPQAPLDSDLQALQQEVIRRGCGD